MSISLLGSLARVIAFDAGRPRLMYRVNKPQRGRSPYDKAIDRKLAGAMRYSPRIAFDGPRYERPLPPPLSEPVKLEPKLYAKRMKAVRKAMRRGRKAQVARAMRAAGLAVVKRDGVVGVQYAA